MVGLTLLQVQATEPGYGIRTRGPWAGLGTCRGLCPSRTCFQVRNYCVNCMNNLNCANIQNMHKHLKSCANMRLHSVGPHELQCANTAQTLRKHCANMHKHCTNMRKHAQTIFSTHICAHGLTCANIAQTLRKHCTNMRKHCANDVCAIPGWGQSAPDPE